jgi:multidrug efflux pump subunit AcrB
MMRFNGQPAIAVAITNQPGVNVVDMGKAVDARLRELIADLPVGIEVHQVHWQSALVEASVREFFVSLAEAVVIVLAVLWLAMGWRMGIVIGSSIVLTILGTFVVMTIFKIDLQRMSLGALVIALGMMVDNSIVVAEGALVRMQQGMDRMQAAIEAAAVMAPPRGNRGGSPGILSHLRLDRECWRILFLAVFSRRDIAAPELGHIGHRQAASVRANAARRHDGNGR